MKHAVDTQTNQFVQARNAFRDRYRYRCPHCGNRVVRAGGLFQISHFRHAAGSFASECPDYHAGTFAQLASARSDTEPAFTPSGVADLFFSCPNKNTRNDWRLTLFVPNPSGIYEWCQFEDSRGRRPRHFSKWCKGAGWRLPVSPQSSQFQVDCGQGDSSVTVWVPGLTAGLNVFSMAPYECRRIDETAPIVAGHHFVLVTANQLVLRQIPGVSFQKLERHDEWNALIFHIDLPVSQAARAWVLEALRREVELPRASLAVVLPPRWSEPFGEGGQSVSAMVSLTSEPGHDTPSSLVLSDGRQQAALLNPLESTPAVFASFQAESDTAYVVFASGWKSNSDGRALLRRFPQPSQSRGIVQSAMILHMRQAGVAEMCSVSLFHSSAPNRLADLCSLRAEIIGVDVPAPVTVTIETANGRFYIAPSPLNTKTPEKFTSLITTSLQQAFASKSEWIRLDAGPYGVVEYGNPHPPVRVRGQVALSSDIRRRLKWTLLSAANMPNAGVSLRDAHALIEQVDSGHVVEEQLLKTLATLGSAVPRVAAHSRALHRIFAERSRSQRGAS